MADRDWNPIRRSDLIYCSPACGGGCTRPAFDAATREAEALAARLGPGWVSRVHENLGWYWSVKREIAEGFSIEISPTTRGGHYKAIATPEVVGYWLDFHTPAGQRTADAPTPEEGLHMLGERAKAERDATMIALNILAEVGIE